MSDNNTSSELDADPLFSPFKQIRHTLMSTFAALAPVSPAINGFVFDSANNLYYFGSPSLGAPESILKLDLSFTDMNNVSAVQILDPSCAASVVRDLTPEQELLFERKRISPKPSGIDSFEIEHDIFLMTAGSNLIIGTPSISGTSLSTNELSLTHAVNAKLCPSCPRLIAFVRDSNLHLFHLSTNQEFKVSSIPPDEVAAGVSAGMASFLVQEDMDRYEGFWWRPAALTTKEPQSYSLLYEVIDDHEVNIKPLYNPINCSVEQQRYPIPGAPISKCDLLVADFSLAEESPGGAVSISLKRRRLSHPLWELIPGGGPGYLVRTGWVPTGESVWVQVINRSQDELQLIEIPLSSFRTAEEWETSSIESNSNLKLLFREKSEYWINSNDLFSILPSTDCFEFIIASSATYFQHLYHVTVPSTLPKEPQSSPCGVYMLQDLTSMCQVTQLTKGKWIVDKENLWIDHKNKLVYYMACSVTPLEQQLHVSSYGSYQTHKVLSESGYFTECDAMDSSCRFAVLTSSNLSTCPEIKLCRINSSPTVSEVELVTLKILHKSAPYPPTFSIPQIHTFKNSKGVDIYCMHSVPRNSEPDKKYPLLVYVYGGPMFRLVTNKFCAGLLRTQIYGDQGFSVLITDNTGSADRGLKFEGEIQHKLGQIEVSDQVEAIEYIDRTAKNIDMSKISIHGWSYGGYLSFLCLAQRPDIFRIAVCGGTVQDWNIYESAYTEKFMGTPFSNPEGYEKGCCEYYVSGLPQESGRLFFLHGQMDENVHFTHVEKLIASIVKAGAPYQLNIFPVERHGVRSFPSRLQMNTSLIAFMKDGLKI